MKTAAASTPATTAAQKKEQAAFAYWDKVKKLYPVDKAQENSYFRVVVAAYEAGYMAGQKDRT